MGLNVMSNTHLVYFDFDSSRLAVRSGRVITPEVDLDDDKSDIQKPLGNDEDLCLRVAGLISHRYEDSDTPLMDYFFSVTTKRGVVRIVGITRTAQALETFTECLEATKGTVGVKEVDTTDVIHAKDPHIENYEGYSDYTRDFISSLSQHIKRAIKSYWVLKIDQVTEGIRIRGRVEYKEDYGAFRFAVDVVMRQWNRKDVDVSGVSFSDVSLPKDA